MYRTPRRLLGLIIMLSACVAALPGATVMAAPTCGECASQARLLAEQEAIQRSQADLLKKNRDYLATLSKNDVSKSIKVKSNILIFVVRLETLKNNIDSLRETVGTQACRACARGGGK
jgi:hypothetical protein